MANETDITVEVHSQEDIITARQSGRELARQSGFGTVDQTRLATVISELVRNALVYAGGGTCRIYSDISDSQRTLHLVVSDEGPGIVDVPRALEPGFSSGGGLGLGLPAVRRLMDDMTIDTHPTGTVIHARMTRKR
ncbi:ATP-binding protein [Magnetospirillum molischianum]|nr:ATP-binding protein [Magnetospirillum molischianum]